MSAQARFYRIPRQTWSSSGLDRTAIPQLHDDGADDDTLASAIAGALGTPGASFILFRDGKVAVRAKDRGTVAWHGYDAIVGLGLRPFETLPSARKSESDGSVLLMLGSVGDSGRFAIEIPANMVLDNELLKDNDKDADNNSDNDNELPKDNDGAVFFIEPRSLITGSGTTARASQPGDAQVQVQNLQVQNLQAPVQMQVQDDEGDVDLACVGQAAARFNWHRELARSPETGVSLVPWGCGHRRRDPTAVPTARGRRGGIFYARTDPVAIMLVQSPDGQRCLLGRTKRRHKSNMYSCLAGFVEQCESVEDAVRRETMEEAGVPIGDEVQVVGTQPWPLGAAGHAELMVGCIARATSDEIDFDADEMDDVRWFTRTEVRDMLARSVLPDAMGNTADGKPIIVPPPFAIAHHLIAAWAQEQHWQAFKAPSASLNLWARLAAHPLALPSATFVAGAIVAALFSAKL